MNINDLMIPQEKTLENQILVVQPDTRTIDVPNDFLLGVETDNDAERVKFQCPKIVGDNLDLSQYHIYIHYQNAKGEKGKYLCEDIEDGGENITFSWLLSQKVTLYKGQTKFLVCAKKTQEDTIVWNTTLANGNVLEGLDVDEDIVQQNDDVIEQILLKLEQIEASGGTGDINNAQVTFAEAQERTNIESQETMSTLFGKIKKWFTDLKIVAFTGSYTDLSNKPDIPTKTSELSNDSGFLTSVPSEYVTDTELDGKGYALASDIPTKTSELTNDSGFLTAIPQEYVTETELEEKGFAKTSDIPTTLPNPNKLTFTGAVSGEYDGSAPLSIEVPQGGAGGGEKKVEVQTIVKHTVTLEEVDTVAFNFSSDEYPLIKQCNHFFIRIKNPTNKVMPYVNISINGKIVNGSGGNQGYSRHNIKFVDNYAYVGVSGWENITLYDERTPYIQATYKYPPIVFYSLDKITIGVGSYQKFLDEGAIIFIQGWHD